MDTILKYYYEKKKDVEEAINETKNLYHRAAHKMLTDEDKEVLRECHKDIKIFEIEALGATANGWEEVLRTTAQAIKLGREPEEPTETTSSDKATRLEKKINGLIEKLEKETNPIKRQIDIVKISWLNEKLTTALRLQQIKEEFDQRRTSKKVEEISKQTGQKISKAALEVQISEIEEQISDKKKKLQPKFDPESPSFIFKTELARHNNNLDSLLEEIGKTEGGAVIVKKIKDTVQAKKEAGVPELESQLAELKAKLAEENRSTMGRTVERLKDRGNLAIDEMSLVVKEKTGILERIGNWGKSLVAKWNDRKKEKDAVKAIKAEGAELVKMYEADVEQTAKENAAEIARLKQEIARLQAETEAARASVDVFKKTDIAKGNERRIDAARKTSREARVDAFRAELTGIRQNTHVDFTPKAGETPVASAEKKGDEPDVPVNDEPEV